MLDVVTLGSLFFRTMGLCEQRDVTIPSRGLFNASIAPNPGFFSYQTELLAR